MSKRENFPDQRKYSTFSPVSTTVGSAKAGPPAAEPAAAPSSLERATDILICLGYGINSATEIATYCDYSISTVHRLLQNLADLNWVIQDDTSHKYFLGPLVNRLSANIATVHQYLILHAMKEMSRISNITEETVILGALEQLHYIKLHDIPSPHNLRIIEASDRLKGQYLGATAKVLLSQLDDKDLKPLLKHIRNEAVTPDSVTDNAVILEQILEIRRKGYFVSYGERIKGAACVSVPVKNYFCPVSLYIVGPEDRIKPRLEKCIKELVSSASVISEDIAGAFNGQGGRG